jgi:hypothetical protein
LVNSDIPLVAGFRMDRKPWVSFESPYSGARAGRYPRRCTEGLDKRGTLVAYRTCRDRTNTLTCAATIFWRGGNGLAVESHRA